jgi:hypothetical protein
MLKHTVMRKLIKNKKQLASKEFDKKFDDNKDVSHFLNFKEAVVVKRVNLDIPKWILDILDREALKLNISRQSIIKMWLSEKIDKLKMAA